MKKFAKMALAAVIAGLSMAASASLLSVDDFSVTQTPFIEDNTTGDGGIWSNSNSSGFSTTILGGYRDLYVEKTGAVGSSSGVQIGVELGALSFSSDARQSGFGIIRWDGINTAATVDATGLGGENLSLGNVGFLLTVIQSDAGFPFTMNIYSSTGNYTSLTLAARGVNDPTVLPGDPDYNPLFPDGPYSYFIPFSDFVGADIPMQAPGVDGIMERKTFGTGGSLANVGAIEAIINTGGFIKNVDLTIDMVQAVPEPESLALVGLGLLGLAVARRRKAAK